MRTARVRVRRHGEGQFVASVMLDGETTPHFDSEPESDPDTAACCGKAWAHTHGVRVEVMLYEAGIRGPAALAHDHVEAP